MEEKLLSVQPTFKLYKNDTISVGTFFGGPLVAGYLAAENFKHLGQHNKVKKTWIIAISATVVVILVVVFLLPIMEKIPNSIIPFTYIATAYF